MATSKRVNWNGFSISNLRTSRGMEWDAMSCDLLLNGKKVAEVIDDGWGGPMNIDMVSGFSYEKLNALCKTFRDPIVEEGFTIEFDAEFFICELIKNEQIARDVRRQNKKEYGVSKVEFADNHRDEWYNIPLSWSDEKLSNAVKKSFPENPVKKISFWRSPSDLDINDKNVKIESLLV